MSGKRHIRPAAGRDPLNTESHGAAAQLSAMAGGIAHDLNTVITTIYGYSEQALETLEQDAETVQYIRRIIAAADRAKTLAGQLLSLSHRVAEEKVPVRVADVLADTIDFIRPSVPSGIRIIRNLSAPDASVMAVPAQLFRILLNLILNAAQAIGEKEGTITVTLEAPVNEEGERTEENGTCLLIRISDTGKGMDSGTAGKIFDPFFTSGKKSGTGLGLTVVSDAVRELGGKIRVSSVRDKGTTFELLIPDTFFGSLNEKN